MVEGRRESRFSAAVESSRVESDGFGVEPRRVTRSRVEPRRVDRSVRSLAGRSVRESLDRSFGPSVSRSVEGVRVREKVGVRGGDGGDGDGDDAALLDCTTPSHPPSFLSSLPPSFLLKCGDVGCGSVRFGLFGAGLHARLLSCWLAGLLACWLACWLSCSLLACLLAC